MRAAATNAVAERSSEPMLSYLSTCASWNKTEVVGALKLMAVARRVNKADKG